MGVVHMSTTLNALDCPNPHPNPHPTFNPLTPHPPPKDPEPVSVVREFAHLALKQLSNEGGAGGGEWGL